MTRSSRRPLTYFFLVLVIITLVASLWTVAARDGVERSRRDAAVFVDLRDLYVLWQLAGADASAHAVLSDLSSLGVTGLVVPVTVPAESVPSTARPLAERVPPEMWLWIDEAQDIGLDLAALVLIPEDTVGTGFLSDLLRSIAVEWRSPFVLFADGTSLPSVSYGAHLLPQLAGTLKANHLSFAPVEFRAAPGETDLAKRMENGVERVHTITPREMHSYSLVDAVQRYLRAVRERGYRNLWVRFNLPEESLQDASDLAAWNLALLQGLRDELQDAGYSLGRPSILPRWSNGWLGVIGAAAGASVSVLALLLLAGAPWFLTLVGTGGTIVGGLALAMVGKPILARQALAFVAANGYASLSIILPLVLHHRPGMERFANGSLVGSERGRALCLSGTAVLRTFSLAIATGFLGGLVITTALGDYRFMLKTYQYLGVKASFLLPLIWISVFVFGWDPRTRVLSRRAFLTNVKELLQAAGSWWKKLALAGAALVLLAVYLARSANFVLPVSNLELWMRTMFEQTLVARPRAKEFLIGHPLFLLGLGCPFALRRFNRVLLVMGGIGAVSITNTFCHVHTPIIMSILRTFYGFVLGGFGGLCLIALVHLSERLLVERRGQGVKA